MKKNKKDSKQKEAQKTERYTFTLSFENPNKKLRHINTIAKDEEEARGHFSILVAQDFNWRADRNMLPDKCIIEKKKGKKVVKEYSFDEYYKLFTLVSVNKVSFYGNGGNEDLLNGRA